MTRLLIALFALLPTAATVHAQTEIEPKSLIDEMAWDFFRRNEVRDPSISPDGSLVAYLETENNVRSLMLLQPATLTKLIIISEEEDGQRPIELGGIWWADDKHLIFAYQRGRTSGLVRVIPEYEGDRIVNADLSTLGLDWYMVHPISWIENHILAFVVSGGQLRLYKVDVRDPDAISDMRNDRRFQAKMRESSFFWPDGDGNIRLTAGVAEESGRRFVSYRKKKSNRWTEIWGGDQTDVFRPVMLGPDELFVYAITNVDSQYNRLVKYNMRRKEIAEIIFEIDGTDIESADLSPARDRVTKVSYFADGFLQHHYFEDLIAMLPEPLDPNVYGARPYIVDLSLDEKKAIVRTSSNDVPGDYHYLDIEDWQTRRFGRVAPWLDRYRLGTSRIVDSTSPDGLKIESYLTLPHADGDRKPPLLVVPHGGPISVRDIRHFDSETQFLATLGYAVLQPNYRGSSGYGKTFEGLGMRQWGRMIEDDIEAAVRRVVDLGLVDPEKICIYGASYGGYSALISAINNSGGYKCAASFAGVTDLPLMFHRDYARRSPAGRQMLERIIGNPETDMETLIEYSPVYNAARLDIPVFIAQGAKDEIVDIEHFFRMRKMLEYYGKDAEFAVYDSEGHGFRYIETHGDFIERLDAFLRRNLGLREHTREQVLTRLALEAEQDSAATPESTR